jgi:hypothetical protein
MDRIGRLWTSIRANAPDTALDSRLRGNDEIAWYWMRTYANLRNEVLV